MPAPLAFGDFVRRRFDRRRGKNCDFEVYHSADSLPWMIRARRFSALRRIKLRRSAVRDAGPYPLRRLTYVKPGPRRLRAVGRDLGEGG
jgi:hypothetical protein